MCVCVRACVRVCDNGLHTENQNKPGSGQIQVIVSFPSQRVICDGSHVVPNQNELLIVFQEKYFEVVTTGWTHIVFDES